MHDNQDIRGLVYSHIEERRSALSDEVYHGILDALATDDMQRVHDLLVTGTYEIFGPDRARRVLREVDNEIAILGRVEGPIH